MAERKSPEAGEKRTFGVATNDQKQSDDEILKEKTFTKSRKPI